MNKTKEQLAEEYAKQYHGDWDDNHTEIISESSYLAGFKASEPKWISVNEELPLLGERVLVWWSGIEICNYVSDYWTRGKPGFLNEQDEQPAQLYPTHWMPLPSPPKQ